MKSRNQLTPADASAVAAEWNRPKGDRQTQQELASRFNVSAVTIRRALAEAGMLELAGHKTVKDTAILEFLKSQGLNDIKALTAFVVKARKGKSA